MVDTTDYLGTDGRATRSNWVRLRTLVMLRWIAIAGQLGAILIAWRYFNVAISLPSCLALVGLSVLGNLISVFLVPQNRRLSEAETLAVLIFDSCQLAALLYLTGGLNNPFALLILAPTTIAATALQGRATVVVGLLAVILVTLLAVHHLDLRLTNGPLIEAPKLFGFGFWLAIVIGVIFLAIYAQRVSVELHVMSDALLATQMALAREQKLTDLSGVVAAAAHELGTPLAIIKLASAELAEELADRADLQQDAQLIHTQANRCRDILQSMGRAGKDDLHLRSAPFAAVVQEAAEPHINRKSKVLIHLPEAPSSKQPTIQRRPEVIHGVRNLVQNAVDFAKTTVWIDLDWSTQIVTLRITDDGPGFPPNLIGRIGDPFMRHRPAERSADDRRPQYEGMGLGLFIAKTLLERTGASLRFSNASDPFLTESERPLKSGAMVEVCWPRALIEVESAGPIGENRLITG